MTEQVREDGVDIQPVEELEKQVRSVLEHAVDAHRRGLMVYQSLQNLNEVIGTEYGDRVLYELIQNAHDAHRSGSDGKIAIKLVVQSESEGVLYVANGGHGFRAEDVKAISNLATSAKEVGEGIGNKGLGFRSVEALTDDVRIFSRKGTASADGFDGYCLRFSEVREIEDSLRFNGIAPAIAAAVARTIPRYLVPRPLVEQPQEILAYARQGYATVIAAQLSTAEAVELASRQMENLTSLDVPLLLFLDRISEIKIDVERPDQEPYRGRLHRQQTDLGDVPSLPDTRMLEVDVGEGRRFLVVRREVDRERVLDAVERSIPVASQLKRWLNWKGMPVVSVAVGLSPAAVATSRLYNFLPMGESAKSPLIGYLDAPFFADIDRRSADLGLPLNETLMAAAAETCVAAALSLAERDIPVQGQAVFDLIAWTGKQATKINEAFKMMGSSLKEARVIPAIPGRGKRAWSSLSEISIWPNGPFAVLKDKDVVRHVGAQLVSKDLDSNRVERLKDVARRCYLTLIPSSVKLAGWTEAFAHTLAERKASPRIWAGFYDDLPRVFDASSADLKLLDEKLIVFDNSGILRPAGGHDASGRSGVYVRSDAPKRKKAGVPLPPARLTRRYRFLDERIHLQRETLDSFIKAGLIREFDPVEALAGLKSVLGKNANQKRREEALIWAFQAWRAAGTRLEDELPEAGLFVPTLSGWQPAIQATFSSSWTPIGRMLENYLIEAADASPDCRRSRDLLLAGQQDWPVSVKDEKRSWIRFLELIGVIDGLRPVPAQVTRRGSPSNLWFGVLRGGNATDGLDKDWCAEVANISFNHPNTDYTMKGEAWRLPGQMEHNALPENTREAFCALVFEFLKSHATAYFRFEVGRFERFYEREWDIKTLPTPLATFLRSRSWIAAVTVDGLDFRSPKECWASRVRRGGPPRFVKRIPDSVFDFSESDELAELAFSSALGVQDWQNQTTAIARLRDLTSVVAMGLFSNDRQKFRSEYQRAWLDVVETGVSLPDDLNLAITRRGQLEILSGKSDVPASVIVTEDAQRFEARILSSAGQAVLEVGAPPQAMLEAGRTIVDRIAGLLEETGAFLPRRLDGIGVQLLVDGEPFVPRVSDLQLSALGLDWLPEIVVIGHELRGEQLERGIQSATVDRRARAIRVRRCATMTLVIDNEEVSPSEQLKWYAFENDELPTLILTHDLTLNWMTLARLLAGGLSRLIDARLRSLEPLLLRLALDRSSDELCAPSDEALAHAIECDVQTILDHRAALRTDLEHILYLLIPVVAYYGGSDLARQLQTDADRVGAKFDARKWLELHLGKQQNSTDMLIDACEHATNRAELRKQLELDYARFNHVLLDLKEAPLSNEAELRQLYDAYLVRISPSIVERLRRHHAADFRSGHDLSTYVERKTLKFLEFDLDWILERETLTMEEVEAHVSILLAETMGDDVVLELAISPRVIDTNRKVAREFALEAMPIVCVWCRQKKALLPQIWQQGEAQVVARHLENQGLLDFEVIKPGAMPALCHRATCWPAGMPETLDGDALGLSKDDIEEEEKRSERDRQQQEIGRRSIQFAGKSLDTSDPKFAAHLQDLAEMHLAENESWFERSRQRTRLVEFESQAQSTGGAGGGGKSGGARRRERQLTDAQRQAMGLASEWLAYQFLRRRHSDYVDETCWVSTYRVHYFGGAEGDDALGFDFQVKTPQADWFYEVKSTLEDSGEFELTANEMRVASSASKDGRRRYRVLYVPYVFSPAKWYVLELPNPMGELTRNRFKAVGRGSVRLRFERQ